jgi:hypothetical protein
MSKGDLLTCKDHGDAYKTYVCRHLLEGINTEWYSGEVDDDHPWPDAWCGICHTFFKAEGEWNERSEVAAELGENGRLLCHLCYERIRASCTTHTV